jgi:hypothetical protein
MPMEVNISLGDDEQQTTIIVKMADRTVKINAK